MEGRAPQSRPFSCAGPHIPALLKSKPVILEIVVHTAVLNKLNYATALKHEYTPLRLFTLNNNKPLSFGCESLEAPVVESKY